MKHLITGVDNGSIAQQLGIAVGDTLAAINGECIRDVIDYQAFCAQEALTVTVEREGESTEYSFEKEEYEPLGLHFAQELMSGMHRCANHCLFCFEEQNPPGARDTLFSRDDDWRLSLMTGSFVTLTNVPDRELSRIIARHASPLYISVHATDPDLRCKLLRNKRAGAILQQLHALAEGGIQFHTQAVLCPGLNDGPQLEKTIHDIAALAPSARSLAVVPVGLTCYRDGLYPLRLFTQAEARRTIEICHTWQAICRKQFGTSFVHVADEFYLLAGMPLPADAEYEGYEQIENGVGMLRLLETEYADAYDAARENGELPSAALPEKHICIATGEAAADWIKDMLCKRPIPGVCPRVQAIPNRFFGNTVNVTGLLTGSDMLHPETGILTVPEQEVWISECMLREGEMVFLDDMTVDQLATLSGKRIRIIRRDGESLFTALMRKATERPNPEQELRCKPRAARKRG